MQNWRTCQALMSKTGRESMMRKISQFDPRAVPMKAAEQARRVSRAYTTDQIRDASAGAATFYIWVSQSHVCVCRGVGGEGVSVCFSVCVCVQVVILEVVLMIFSM